MGAANAQWSIERVSENFLQKLQSTFQHARAGEIDSLLKSVHARRIESSHKLLPELTALSGWIDPNIQLVIVMAGDTVVEMGAQARGRGVRLRIEQVLHDSTFWQQWWRTQQLQLGLPTAVHTVPDSLAEAYEALASPLYDYRFGTDCGSAGTPQLGYLATLQLVQAGALPLLNNLLAAPGVSARLFAIMGLRALRLQGWDVGPYLDRAVAELTARSSALGKIEACNGCITFGVTARQLLDPTAPQDSSVYLPYGSMISALSDTPSCTPYPLFQTQP